MTPLIKLASSVAIGIGANTENLPVGLGYGLRGMQIGLGRNLLIAGVTAAATLFALTIGRDLRGYLPPEVPDIVSGLLLVGLGLSGLWSERRKIKRQRSGAEPSPTTPKLLDLRETLVLAGALSINNVGLGFAGGIAGLDHGPVGLSVGGFSVLLLWLGEWLSRRVALPLTSRLGRLHFDGNLLIVVAGILVMVGL